MNRTVYDPNWISAAEESRQEINELLERKSRESVRCRRFVRGAQCENEALVGRSLCWFHGPRRVAA